MAEHILGRRPANIFCKVNQIAKKTIAKSVDAHVAVGGCLPFPYDFLTIPLPFPHHSLTKFATRCEGAIRRLLVVPYHSHLISLQFPYHSLTTRLPNLQQDVREPSGDCWWFHTIPIRCPYHVLSIPFTTPLPCLPPPWTSSYLSLGFPSNRC